MALTRREGSLSLQLDAARRALTTEVPLVVSDRKMTNTRVLDLDLAFFLSAISRRECPRAEKQGLVPWKPARVRRFLEQKCALSRDCSKPGAVLMTHDEVFFVWKQMFESATLFGPLDLVHVDAHADLGMGDASWAYVSGELLHLPVEERRCPMLDPEDGLTEGNFLLFAIACRWIASLTYVYHPDLNRNSAGDDVPENLYVTRRRPNGRLELPVYNCPAYGTPGGDAFLIEQYKQPAHLEPSVSFRKVHARRYTAQRPFDYVFLTCSPYFTPSSADALIPLIREFIIAT